MTKIPRPEHPRPDWFRPKTQWQTLNGEWNFAFDDHDIGEDHGWWQWNGEGKGPFEKTIVVPFAHQTEASGIADKNVHEVIWYARTIEKPTEIEKDETDRIVLHFGAVDYQCTIWVGGVQVKQHQGGHVGFKCDITPQIKHFVGGKDSQQIPIVIRVRDAPNDVTQPRGKQYWKQEIESIWYYPTSGIWQPVWLEHVGRSHIDKAVITTDIDRGTIHVAADLANVGTSGRHAHTAGAFLEAIVTLSGVFVGSSRNLISNQTASAAVTVGVLFDGIERPSSLESVIKKEQWQEGIALWSPDHPTLYDIQLSLITSEGKVLDVVQTYTGMRKIHVENGKVYLNNVRLFQALNLDQGYWPGSGLTAPTDEAFKIDIEGMKAVGMNGCRKHQKVEDPRFLYWADKLGYLVWGEMASPYAFSQEAILRFQAEWTEAVMQQINHPSIISWTPFNESWGVPNLPQSQRQRNYLTAMYYLTKTLDPSRLIISNDGWEQGPGDMLGFHDYIDANVLRNTAANVNLILMPKSGKDIILPGEPAYDGKPILCTEMGGISLEGADGDRKDSWGYHKAANADELLERIKGVVDAIIDGGICQGFCYTQTTDTEQETNGILTKEREQKIDPEKLRHVFGRRPYY
jgi:beta-galactosidase/beta-glucuronidase